MLTGEIRSQIDSIWNAFWTEGISNPLGVIEQNTYLVFLRRLERARPCVAQTFSIAKFDIAATNYGLRLNRNKEVIYAHVDHAPPQTIIAELSTIEAEIQHGIRQLEGMLA